MASSAGLAEIVVAVGTDHHPFDRLIRWIDHWAERRPGIEVLIQRGTAEAARHCPSVELLPHPELCERFAMSTVVVSHGGPSTVMDARMAGRLPIVVPRDPELGEHVDDHQLRFASHLHRHGLARVADDERTLHRLLGEAMDRPEWFAVAPDQGEITGVMEFARRVDGLLGTTTPMVPTSPAGAMQAEVTEDRPVR